MIDHLREHGLGVGPVCRVLDLSPSTCFARKKRPKTARRFHDEQLIDREDPRPSGQDSDLLVNATL